MFAASRQDQGNPLVHVFDLWVVEAKTNLDFGRPDFNSGDPNLLSVGNAAANETAVVVDSDTLIGWFWKTNLQSDNYCGHGNGYQEDNTIKLQVSKYSWMSLVHLLIVIICFMSPILNGPKVIPLSSICSTSVCAVWSHIILAVT